MVTLPNPTGPKSSFGFSHSDDGEERARSAAADAFDDAVKALRIQLDAVVVERDQESGRALDAVAMLVAERAKYNRMEDIYEGRLRAALAAAVVPAESPHPQTGPAVAALEVQVARATLIHHFVPLDDEAKRAHLRDQPLAAVLRFACEHHEAHHAKEGRPSRMHFGVFVGVNKRLVVMAADIADATEAAKRYAGAVVEPLEVQA